MIKKKNGTKSPRSLFSRVYNYSRVIIFSIDVPVLKFPWVYKFPEIQGML